MRFSIWTAVSTEAQATGEKVSLSEQENKCRTAGLAKGWHEVGSPYVVPGESRTRWVNLRDAEEAIPALRAMLNSAQRGDFDVLVLYDYTRLRDLLDPVAKTLSAYHVQLYSINQPVEPLLPDQFDLTNETASSVQFIAGFTSRTEIAALKRRYRLGMPRRIADKGLPKGRPPFGYRKPPGRELDRQAVPIQDPAKVAIILQIKDLFLAGLSLWQIARKLNEKNIPTPSVRSKWSDANVRLILKNRFYSGEVSFGRTRRTLDPRTGSVKVIDNDPARIVTATGAHAPLWDKAVQRRIDSEFQRRGKKYTGIRTQRLSGLLYCGICGARVWVGYPGAYSEKGRKWHCSIDPSHVNLFDRDLLPRITDQLVHALQHLDGLTFSAPDDSRPLLSASLADLTSRRERLTDALEAGALDPAAYSARIKSIESQMTSVRAQLADSDHTAERSTLRRDSLTRLAAIIERIPDFIAQAPAQEVNTQLHQLIEKIVITPTDTTLAFR